MQCFAWLFYLSTGAEVLDSILEGDDGWCTEDELANCGGLAGTIVVVERHFGVHLAVQEIRLKQAGQRRALGEERLGDVSL